MTSLATVEVLYAANAQIGEGPFYEQETNQLLWVDSKEQTVNFLSIDTRVNRSLKMPDLVGAVIPVEKSNKLVVLVGRKICLVDRETGGIVEELAQADTAPNTRFNDAKCDSKGRLWCGTMDIDIWAADQGALYCFNEGKLTKFVSPVGISNGIGWSKHNKTMYYNDSLPAKVYKFDFNADTGTISNQQVFIDYSQDESLGLPDGLCTDVEGRLWIASYGGKTGVNCWDSQTGEHIRSISIPGACNVTSCCFGGPNYEWLFVTSANVLEESTEYPNAGSVFVVKGLGTRGAPVSKFKL